MNRILLGISIMILAGCGSGNSKSTVTNNSNGSRFEWNFNKQRKFIYSFSQTVKGENKMDKDSPTEKNYVIGFGHLNITVKENNLADISLTDIEMKIIEFSQDGTPKDTMTHNTPTTVVQDMRTNGSFEDSNTEVLFDLLFPLPNKNILDGKSNEIPMKMPFNANGSTLFSKGQNKLTFLEFKEIEGRNCVVFKGDINISELEVPAELKGIYKYTTIGNATYYFDLENGYYVGADVKIVMDVMMDTETHNYDESGMYMETTSESVYKIRLENIEE